MADGVEIKVTGHDLDTLLKAGIPVKYLSEKSEFHNGKESFIKNAETFAINLKAEAHARLFDLSKEEDLKEYNRVWNDATAGKVVISAEERHWDDSKHTFIVFLRWGEYYIEIP